MFYCVEIYGNISTFGCLYFLLRKVYILYLWFLSFPSGSIGYLEEHSIFCGLYSSPSAVPRSYHLLLSLFRNFFQVLQGSLFRVSWGFHSWAFLAMTVCAFQRVGPSHLHFLLWISRPILSCLVTSNWSWDMFWRFVLQVSMAYRRIDSTFKLNILIFVYFQIFLYLNTGLSCLVQLLQIPSFKSGEYEEVRYKC